MRVILEKLRTVPRYQYLKPRLDQGMDGCKGDAERSELILWSFDLIRGFGGFLLVVRCVTV